MPSDNADRRPEEFCKTHEPPRTTPVPVENPLQIQMKFPADVLCSDIMGLFPA
jgi:hypothetical protein